MEVVGEMAVDSRDAAKDEPAGNGLSANQSRLRPDGNECSRSLHSS